MFRDVVVSAGEGKPSVVLIDQVSIFRELMPLDCALHKYFRVFFLSPLVR